MKLSAVVVTRNDNYGGNLNERATYCLNSLINTFDEVILVDWNHYCTKYYKHGIDKSTKLHCELLGSISHPQVLTLKLSQKQF